MKPLSGMILFLALLMSSALARPRAYEDRDEEENAWPISARKDLFRRYQYGIK